MKSKLVKLINLCDKKRLIHIKIIFIIELKGLLIYKNDIFKTIEIFDLYVQYFSFKIPYFLPAKYFSMSYQFLFFLSLIKFFEIL